MKNDINLLQKRKGKKYPAQKVALLLLVIAMFAGAVYAGFMFPGSARTDARLAAAALSGELTTSSDAQQNLSDLTALHATRTEQLAALTALDGARSDVSSYLDAVERSLPVSVNISSLSVADRTINILGVAINDDDIAAFCIRLRETGRFSNVFLQNSIAGSDGSATFSVVAELPVTLDSSAVLPEETEEKDEAETAVTTGEVTP